MNETRLVTLPSKNIRDLARQALRGQWKQAAFVSFLLCALIVIPMEILNFVFQQSTFVGLSVYFVYGILVEGPFIYGSAVFFLSLFRKKEHETAQIFQGFEHFGTCIVLLILMTVKIFLWSLLFFVPGVIAAFRYSQAFFVLVDHPEYTATQCIEESKRIMDGNKAKLFCLELSFIGWSIIAYIPMYAVSTMYIIKFGEMVDLGFGVPSLVLSPTHQLIISVINLVTCIGMYFVTAYMYTAFMAFYELATAHLSLERGASIQTAMAGFDNTSSAQQVNIPMEVSAQPLETPIVSEATPQDSAIETEEQSENSNQQEQ